MKNTPFERFYGHHFPRDIQKQRMQQVIQEELTELQRYTLVAYYFQEKNLRMIAEERNVSKSTVWRTLKRAEEKLRRFMRY